LKLKLDTLSCDYFQSILEVNLGISQVLSSNANERLASFYIYKNNLPDVAFGYLFFLLIKSQVSG